MVDVQGERERGKEEERKTETEVNGHYHRLLEREGTFGQRWARPGCVEATGQKH